MLFHNKEEGGDSPSFTLSFHPWDIGGGTPSEKLLRTFLYHTRFCPENQVVNDTILYGVTRQMLLFTEHMRGAAPALNPIQTKSVPLRAGSFADTLCREADTGMSGVVRLVMLGVARKYQKRGFGQDLLCDFFEHVKIIHQALPIKGVYLDADPAAINFYARLGFVQLSATPNAFGAVPMFLAIQHILAA